MADVKISGLPASTLPLAGTEVLPLVQSGVTKKVATDDLTVKNVRSNATTGLLQIAGPTAGTTRVMTTPDANFTVARTDAGQTFTGTQNFAALTASSAVATDASKNLVSVTNTGTGNNVLATTPTFSGSPVVQGSFAVNQNNSFEINNGQAGANRYATGMQLTSNAGGSYATSFYISNGSATKWVLLDGGPTISYLNGANTRVFSAASSGDCSVMLGNLVISTSGKGIDFSATPGTGTSELFSDYEEGTWTGVITGSTGAPTTPNATTCTYTKIGRSVTVNFPITLVDTTGATGNLKITGLPFSAVSDSGRGAPHLFNISFGTSATYVVGYAAGTEITFLGMVAGSGYVNVPLSAGASRGVGITITYIV
jgi:hypothetical protein